MAKLVVIRGEADQREFVLKGETVLGRSATCDLRVRGRLGSRRHAKFTSSGGIWFVEDMGSANGTVLNGQRVQRAQLHDGDAIGLGDCELTFLFGDSHAVPRTTVVVDDTESSVIEAVEIEKVTAAVSADAAPGTESAVTARLRGLRAALDASCAAMDMQALVKRLLDELLGLFPLANHSLAVLFTLGKDGEDLSESATRPGQRRTNVTVSKGLVQATTADRKAIMATLASSESGDQRQGAPAEGERYALCCPLLLGRRCLGLLHVEARAGKNPFTRDDLILLTGVCEGAAVTVENLRLCGESEARKHERAVQQALNRVAHCAKSAVNGMAGGAYMVERGIQKSEMDSITGGWEKVRRGTRFLAELSKDILAYARPGEPRREPTDVGHLVEDAVSTIRPDAERKGVEVALVGSQDVQMVEVDPIGLRTIVVELLKNAVEASQASSTVHVTLGMDGTGDRLQISVTDEGSGMPDDVRRVACEPFFTTKGAGRAGLGLALVHKAVEEHHGTLDIQSQRGGGTAVIASVPLHWEEEETLPMMQT